MDILAIIPIFSKNETIPRMYSRFLVKKPLFLHVSESLRLSEFITDIYLITDDSHIAHIAELNKFKNICDNQFQDNKDLDSIEYLNSYYDKIEQREKKRINYMVIVQPNYPLIKASTIDNSIKKFIDSSFDSAISVKFSEHDDKRRWKMDQDGIGINVTALNECITLPADSNQYFNEINGIKIFDRKRLQNYDSYLDSKTLLIELSFPENLEIKKHFDWWIAEKYLKRKRILIRVDGYNEIGLGHIYRQLILVNNLMDHENLFVSKREFTMGINLIKEHNYKLKCFSTDEEFQEIIEDFNPDIIINDILDTDEDLVKLLKKRKVFVINFEDLGTGAKQADLVINALYQKKDLLENHYWGKDYYLLREEFHLLGKKEILEDVKTILITFGGTDPNNYTEKVLEILDTMSLQDIKVVVILGLGYKNPELLKEKIKKFGFKIVLKQHVNHISKYMSEADIALTAAGRTVYELASIGVPTIVLTENQRGLLHTFANEKNGIINVGLGVNIPPDEIKQAIKKLMTDYNLRKKNNQLMLKNNLRSGLDNVISLIFSHYEKWESSY